MRKAYILKKLTGQVRSFAALMLITLLAVGNVLADEVTYVFSQQGYENAQVITSGSFNDFVTFTAASGNTTNTPKYYNSGAAARFYASKEDGMGNSMTLYPAPGYKITGVTINAKSNNTPPVAYAVDGQEADGTTSATGTVYSWSGFEAFESFMFRNALMGSTNPQLHIISITVTYEPTGIPVVAAPTFSIPSGIYYTAQEVALSDGEEGANIYYAINGSDPVLYNGPFTVNTTSTITAYAVVGDVQSITSTLDLTFPVQLPNIAAFKAAENGLYHITGDVTYVLRDGRNIYLQDASGSLLIYDNNTPIITTEYEEGDVIPGVIGNRTVYSNILVEMVPTLNTPASASQATITYEEVTVAELLSHPENYLSSLVMIRDGNFAAGSFTTSSKSGINFIQGDDTILVYNQFKTVSATFSEGEQASVIGLVGWHGGVPQIYPRYNSDIILTYATLPFACAFEGGCTNYWTLENGENTNKWYIGTAQGFDDSKLYISSSNGATNKYNVSAASVSHAYMKVNLPASDVILNFKCRSVGEANDFLQVSLVDEAPEAGTVPETYLTRIYGMDDFDGVNILIPASNAGVKYLVFTWNNDNNGGTQSPAAIDNVIMYTTCTQVSNIAATVDGQTATITWDAIDGQTAWDVQYKDVNSDAWQTVTANTPSVTLNNLSTEVTYDVRVRANCGSNGVSAWANAQFYVPCMTLTTGPVEIVIGEDASTSTSVPFYQLYNNAWVQMVYPASEFATAGYINSISWYVNNGTASPYSSLKIYMGTKADAINNSTTDWLSMDELTLVYDGTDGTLGTTTGAWETYTLNTPFPYNGEDNLVIVTARKGTWKSLYYRYTSTSNAVLERHSDSSPDNYGEHPGNQAGSRIALLPNIKIDYTGYVCGDEHCAAPADLTVEDITTDGAVLNWEAGDATAWQVNYKADYLDDWTTVDVTENTYTLTGLDQNTNYMVRVLADCGTIGMSNEAVVNFTTVASCPAPQNLAAVAHMHTVNVSWLPVEGVSNYEVMVEGVNNNTLFAMDVQNASQTNLTGFVEGGQYIIRVKALCDDEETSEWSSIDFIMPTICVAPTGITVTEVGQHDATITWTPSEAPSWIVEYGLQGFTLGEGTQLIVTEPTVTIAGLNTLTCYDVYVKANCGLGYMSPWSSKKSFETECGILTVTTENPFFENFDTHYSGSGAKALSYCWTTPVTYIANNGVFPAVYAGWSEAAHSGSNSLEVKGDNGMFTLPEFSNDINTLQIMFWANTTASDAEGAGTMEVGVLADFEDLTTFVPVDTVVLTAFGRSNTLLYGPYTFENVVPQAGQRIAFRYANADASPSWNMDDFTVELKPDCQIPTSLSVTGTTATTATLAWNANGSETTWNIEYGPAGFEAGEGTLVVANANPFTITGLTEATAYDFYVQANCGDLTSEWSDVASATTPLQGQSIPYFTDFTEGGWILNNGTCANVWTMGTPSNKDYPSLFISGDGTSANYIISGNPSGVSAEKLFDMPADSTIHITFDLEAGGESMYDYLKVYLAPADNEYPATTTNTSGTYTHYSFSTYALNFLPYLSQTGYTSTGTNYQYKINLTKGNILHIDMDVTNPTPNGQAKLVFWWRNDNGTGTQPGAIISNLQVGNPTCPTPTNLAVANITANSAQLSWTAGGEETAWIVEYKLSSEEEWTSVDVNTNSYALTDLNPLSEYSVRVKANCVNEESQYARTTFMTEMLAVAIPYTTDFTDGGWYLNNGTCTNKWTMGTPSNKEYPALFVSNDGNTAAYTISSAVSVVTAEKLFLMPADDSIHVVFDVEAGGETTWDFLKVFLSPSTTEYPASTSVSSSSPAYATTGYSEYAFNFSDYVTSNTYKLNLTQGNIVHVDMMVPNPTANGRAKLVFLWRNDGGGGTQPGAIISNLQVGDGVICAAPTNLNATTVTDGASTITWTAGGEETSWSITLTPNEGDASTIVVTEPTYTVTGMEPGDSYEVSVKAICGEDEESAVVTTTVLCPALVDIAIVDVYTTPSNCDLSGAMAQVTVKNVREGSTISAFTASYAVNGGDPVTENVALLTPIAYGETATYRFNTAPVFTEPYNVLTYTVSVEGETNVDDNVMNSGITSLTETKNIPYVEQFGSLEAALEWFVMDNNHDGSKFTVGSSIQYTASDENAADDWTISPCFGPMGSHDENSLSRVYLVSYDYKANSVLYNESFTAYFNDHVGFDGGNFFPLGSNTFNNTEYVTQLHYITMDEDEVLDNAHIMFHAESPVGTDGFSIDNVSIKKAGLVMIPNANNGTVSIDENAIAMATSSAVIYIVPFEEESTLTLTPDAGYHVGAIYVIHRNGQIELLRGENPNNAAQDYCNFVPSTGEVIYVNFVPNEYNVNATVSNVMATEYNDNAPGAIYTPAHEQVAYGGVHNGVINVEEYFRIAAVTVNGLDVTSNLVNLGVRTYGLTLDPVMEDKDIQVYTELEDATVTYYVSGGAGIINNTFEVEGTAPVYTYTVTLPGYSDLTSTFEPAPGYHVESVIVDGVEHVGINTYVLGHLLGSHTVVVTFAPNHYVITTSSMGNGSVSEGMEFVYHPDVTYTFTATPDAGNHIESITRNGEALMVENPAMPFSETLTFITDDYHYVATFARNAYTVTAISGNNGTVSPAGVASYFYHEDAVYSIEAELGYYIASVMVDGVTTTYTQSDNLTSMTHTFSAIEIDHTIAATFAPIMYNVTVNAGANGAITPGTGNFQYGTTPTFAITPDAGYSIVDVLVDGVSMGAIASYTFPALTANHTIAATFSAQVFTISATAGNGGTITPAGNATVAYNGNKNYTIAANAGYHVSDVFVDGVSVGAVTSYTFTGVTTDHTIYATFESNDYTVTVNAPAHVMITPGTMMVQYGATPSFVVTPDAGYYVTSIKVNGQNVNLVDVPNVNGVYTYTFAAISANQTLTATVAEKTYTITATSGNNGNISPNGSTTVTYGGSQTYVIAPANGYVVDNVTVDGVSVGALTSYVFTNVVSNHTIHATFKAAECEVPTFLYTSGIDSTSAELHWYHPEIGITYDIQYKTAAGTFTSITGVYGNSYMLTDLNPNTTYLWQIRANCSSSNHSDWSNMVSFTTAATSHSDVGIDDFVKDQIKVYADHQNVHVLNLTGVNIDNVRIFDVYGKLIYTSGVTSDHEVINLNVAAGTYVVNVATDKGVANYKVTLMK